MRRHFGVVPTTLVAPGDAFTEPAVALAAKLGLRLMSSYYLALRAGGRFAWCQHVCAPYLDTGARKWLAGGLPAVGYFHDKDIADRGVRWFAASLDKWQRAGARNFIDFRALAAITGRTLDYDGRKVRITTDPSAPQPVRELPIRTSAPS